MARIREKIRTEKIRMRTSEGDRLVLSPSYFHYTQYGKRQGVKLTWFKMRQLMALIESGQVKVPGKTGNGE